MALTIVEKVKFAAQYLIEVINVLCLDRCGLFVKSDSIFFTILVPSQNAIEQVDHVISLRLLDPILRRVEGLRLGYAIFYE